MYGLYNGYGGMCGGGIMMFVFWVLVIILIVWVVREISGKNKGENNRKSFEILKERYAKGEITKEEFEIIKKDLGL